ncbi:MAG: hypothetical protein AAGC74_06700 [Verrucomicrobiota bacterium]
MKKISVLVATTASSLALELSWTGDGSDNEFLNPDNWSTPTVPSTSDNVTISSLGNSSGPVIVGSTAAVNSITASAPLNLSDTLTVNSASVFNGSLIAGGLGRLRANGPVTLNDSNALNNLVLEGTSSFTNNGTVTIGTRGITTTFTNEGVATLLGASTRLTAFANQSSGILNLGERGLVNSASILVNGGIIRKDNPAQQSFIGADFTQTDGTTEIKNGAFLQFDGLVQEFKGGDITVDGTLQLTQTVGGTTSRTFDGLSSITGPGTVNQIQPYELKKSLRLDLPNAPGFQLGNLVVGDAGPPSSNAILLNEGYLTIASSETLTPADPNNDNNAFINSSGATVEQSQTSNATLAIDVENNGTWIMSSMRTQKFENKKTVVLRGVSKTIAPLIGISSSTFTNTAGSTVSFDPSVQNQLFTFTTKYDQEAGAQTNIAQGTLALNNGSDNLSGFFDIDSDGTLTILNGVYDAPDEGLALLGPGLAIIGDTNLDPTINYAGTGDSVTFSNDLGIFPDGNFNTDGGLRFDSGTLLIGVTNGGIFRWQGGSITGFFDNFGELIISAGSRPRILQEQLINRSNENASLTQSTSLTLSGPEAKITNLGSHTLTPNSSISGGTYENMGCFVGTSGTNALISSTFDNYGLIDVQGTANLSLPSLTNYVLGTLTGGTYEVGPSASITLDGPILKLVNASWRGPGTELVTCITDSFTTLNKTTSDTHTNPLSVENGATLELGPGTTTTIPTVTIRTWGQLTGSGELLGNLDLSDSGNIAPGDSPGTLTITGTTTFGVNSTYEWEAASPSTSDLLAISTATILSGTLTPILLDDYVPIIGQTFTILTAPAVTGSFGFIDLSNLPPGLTVTPTYNATSVTLTFASTSFPTFAAWQTTRFSPTELLDPNISGPDADPDNDDLTNKEEYAFGLNPKKPDVYPLELVATTASSMDLRFPWTNGNEATYTVLTSPTLSNFLPTSSSLQSTTSNTAPGLDQLTIRSTHPSSTTQFSQLSISLPTTP